MDSLGSQASLFSEGEDSALETLFDVSFGVMGAAGAVEQTGPISFSLVEAFSIYRRFYARFPDAGRLISHSLIAELLETRHSVDGLFVLA